MADQNYIIASTESGNINIGEDVFLRLISATVEDMESVAGFSAAYGPELADFLGKKNLSKGINLATEEDGRVRIDVVITVRYGNNVAETAEAVQEKLSSAVESMTGLNSHINVHVTGISFEKAEVK